MESDNPTNVDVFKFVNTAPHQLRGRRCELDKKCTDHVLLKMLEEGLHTDITLIAKGGSVKAHRSVLVGVSPVFCAMFQHNMKEQLTFTVDIPDMTIDGLQLFLLLLYTTNEYSKTKSVNESTPQLFSDAIDEYFAELWEAALKYQVVTRLKHVLLSTLGRKLTPDNCWDYYSCSQQVRGVSKVCDLYILGHFDAVIGSESLVKEMRRNPEHVQNIMKKITIWLQYGYNK